MKTIILSCFVGAAVVLVSGCEAPRTHPSVTTTEKTEMPDLNSNTVTPGQVATTNLNPTVTEDMHPPK